MTDNTQQVTSRIETHISGLNHHRSSVLQLQSVWDNLSLLAQLSGTGTDMSQTRVAFSQLTNSVLENLSKEMLNKTVTGLASKAFVIINIVVRNLFERTADIGFLSTDDDIRDLLLKYHEGEADAEELSALSARFDEYVKKYSVYDNIILLTPDGKVIVQLNKQNKVSQSADPLIAEALVTTEPYIEIYRKTDLLPDQEKGLIYAYKVVSPDNQKVLGILCLCFNFEKEMSAVFKNLIPETDWTIGLMLNEDQHVIASSDPHQIPLDAKLEITKQGVDWVLTRFAGREYISVTRKTFGYQGYMGPGWMGHAMIPLEHAFDHNLAELINGIDSSLLTKVMRSSLIFSQELLSIPKKAAMIQSRLNQSVWNGNIWQSNDVEKSQNKFSKTLLWEISNTGLKTQSIIEQTVSELYQTVVSIMLENSRFFAFLAVDIMDRNLYERANDCRWWALTLSFRKILAQSQRSADDIKTLSKILFYINSLYTVYDNLVIFDRQGSVLAVSNPDYIDCLGITIDNEWVTRLRGLNDSQDYVVSKFEASPLYNGKPTYIYAAAIRAPESNAIVGGIGIVFDSEPQFLAMLKDVMPRNDKGRSIKDSFTLFVDGDSKVISSTHKDISIGSTFNIHPNLCKLNPGQSAFDIALYGDLYFAVGACASAGYREFKGENDDYKNQITSMIFIPLGNANAINALIQSDQAMQHNQFKASSVSTNGSQLTEYATFYVGESWFGIPTTQVIEAIEPKSIRSLPNSSKIYEGILEHNGVVIPIMNMAKVLNENAASTTDNQQIIILKTGKNDSNFGILVSALGEIPSIDPTKIEPIGNIFSGNHNHLAVGIIKLTSEHNQSNMLTILSSENLWNRFNSNKLLVDILT